MHDFFYINKDITPALCTEALQREVRESMEISDNLIKDEKIYAFKAVEKTFKVIEDQSQLAIIDMHLIEKIENYEQISWQDIQNGSVRVRENILRQLSIQESRQFPGVFLWTAEYTSFLGYMDAVLKLEKIEEDGFAII